MGNDFHCPLMIRLAWISLVQYFLYFSVYFVNLCLIRWTRYVFLCSINLLITSFPLWDIDSFWSWFDSLILKNMSNLSYFLIHFLSKFLHDEGTKISFSDTTFNNKNPALFEFLNCSMSLKSWCLLIKQSSPNCFIQKGFLLINSFKSWKEIHLHFFSNYYFLYVN